MRLKLFLFVLAVVGMLFSCTDEMLVDSNGADIDIENPDSRETIISIQLPTGTILTKGDDESDPVLYATADELDIHDCIIAIFNEKGILVGYKRVTKEDLSAADSDFNLVTDEYKTPVGDVGPEEGNTKLYSISNVTTRYGKNMTMFVVANSEKIGELPVEIGVTEFSAYEKLYESTFSFEDKNLVKVGILEIEEIKAKKDQSFTVPLTQLSARIDLKILLGGELLGNWDYSINWMKIYNQRQLSYWLYPAVKTNYTETGSLTSLIYENDEEKQTFKDNGYTFYSYEKKWYSSDDLEEEGCDVLYVDLNIHITNGDDTYENRTYRLTINPRGLGPDKDRHGILHGNLYEITAKLNSISQNFELEYEAVGWWGEPREVTIPDFK